jgi:hypothetical protein
MDAGELSPLDKIEIRVKETRGTACAVPFYFRGKKKWQQCHRSQLQLNQ